jgi:membrane-associated phospholipid phosphatase
MPDGKSAVRGGFIHSVSEQPNKVEFPTASREFRKGWLPLLGIALMLVLFPERVSAQIEPNAGQWKTWVLSSGSQLRLPPPPDQRVSKEEVEVLAELATQRDANAVTLIRFWDSGSPSYQWNQIAVGETSKLKLNTPRSERVLALVHVAIYDAMVAAWDSKYTYHRPRPSDLVKSLTTAIPNPDSPSYPSEHAVAAGAASAVLAYLFPADTQSILAQAQAAAMSRLLAGVQYPSDVQAGLTLGQEVAALVIARAQADGSDAVFSGAIPNGPCNWKGTNPAEPLAGTWRTWVLSSGSEFRVGPPPACDSAQEANELLEVKSFPRVLPAAGAAFDPESKGFFWQGKAVTFWSDLLDKKIFENRLENNPPRAARAYALEATTGYDAMVACWDSKYTYWAIRPVQLDPTTKTLFTTPNHPSYPSAHACVSGANAGVLAYLFPQDAAFFQAEATEAAESRLWSGIHFRSDLNAGLALAQAVTQAAVARAQNDGSQ